MGISHHCQEQFAGNKICSSRSEKKRKLKVLQKSFSSKNSDGHPDCHVTNRPRNFRQSFILVAQSMETTPEKMFFFFPKKTCFLANFFWSLKNPFQKLRQATFALRQKWKNCWSKPDGKWKLILFQNVFFSQKRPMDIWTAIFIATTKTSCQKSVTSSLVGFKKCQTTSFQRHISSQNRYGI